MDEVEIEVVRPEGLEGLVETSLDVVVEGRPDFGSDEDFRAGDTGVLDSLSDLVFVLIRQLMS